MLIEKSRWPPRPLISRDIFDFSFETAERNSTELDRKQDLNVLYQVCFFFRLRLRHFQLLWNHWTEFNETWWEARSQLPLPSLCFSGQKQDGCPASDWLRHFRLSYNCWMEFHETWQEASTQHPLASLSFSGKSYKHLFDCKRDTHLHDCGLFRASCFFWATRKNINLREDV